MKIIYCILYISIFNIVSFSDIFDPLNFKSGDNWIYDYNSEEDGHNATFITERGRIQYTINDIIANDDSILYIVEQIRDLGVTWSNQNGSSSFSRNDTLIKTLTMSKYDIIYTYPPALFFKAGSPDSTITEKVIYKNDTLYMKSLLINGGYLELKFLENYGVIFFHDAFPGGLMGVKNEFYSLRSFNNNEFDSSAIQYLGTVQIEYKNLKYDFVEDNFVYSKLWKYGQPLSIDIFGSS